MKISDHVACTGCGCVCDDLRVEVHDDRIVSCEGACGMAELWLLAQGSRRPPVATIEGEPADLSEAIERAADILDSADAPLIFGLSRSSTDGQRAAVALAEDVGANIDSTASVCHGQSIMAIQEMGEVTCTLGEVRNRADLVIFWGSDPVSSHPRHLERYSMFAAGKHVPRGRDDRTLVVVDVHSTDTSRMADLFLSIEPGKDFEALTVLRSLVLELPVPDDVACGLPLDALRDLAQRMKRCRYGVVFFGLGLSRPGTGQHNVEALLRLVRDLNRFTRFNARRMRIPGDVTGADLVLTWQTGYPFSVNLARGYPRYNPGEYTAQDLLERRDVDACLFVGTEAVARLSSRAREELRHIPTIVLDYPTVESLVEPTLRFTTAVYGIHVPGLAYRMDTVPIPLRELLPSHYPADHVVLEQIRTALRDRTPAN